MAATAFWFTLIREHPGQASHGVGIPRPKRLEIWELRDTVLEVV